MIETITLSPGVTLRCYQDKRFKQGRLSIQLVRPMCREEAAMNALLPAVLLRGTQKHPDLRSITMHLDDLYGAAVGDLVRRVGDYQATGISCGFTEDRFAMAGDEILAPVVDFLGELLLRPLTREGVFCPEIVESEKKNRIADIESEFNDKRVYAAGCLMKLMCPEDSFGIPRLGDTEQVAAITPEGLYGHYQQLLRQAAVEIFYVGSADPRRVAGLLEPMFAGLTRQFEVLPPQTSFHDAGGRQVTQDSAATQSVLNMGFVTPITNQSPDFAAMQVLNTLFGAGMTSKLFMNIREKMSLCYSIGSGYYGSKGIVTVSAGIDAEQEPVVRSEVLRQLENCRKGDISDGELTAAKEAVLSSLRAVLDSPGSIESWFATAALSGLAMTLEEYGAAVEKVTAADAAAAACTLVPHSGFFLKGVAK